MLYNVDCCSTMVKLITMQKQKNTLKTLYTLKTFRHKGNTRADGVICQLRQCDVHRELINFTIARSQQFIFILLSYNIIRNTTLLTNNYPQRLGQFAISL